MKTIENAPMFKVRSWRLWTYDVWGNARDGFDVNDRYRTGTTISIRCKRETHNAGTEREFRSWHPTERQLARALGAKGCEFEWTDSGYEISLKSNGKPVGQLEETSGDNGV